MQGVIGLGYCTCFRTSYSSYSSKLWKFIKLIIENNTKISKVWNRIFARISWNFFEFDSVNKLSKSKQTNCSVALFKCKKVVSKHEN